MTPLALLLFAVAPAAPVQEDARPGVERQTPPRLPAPLAWLEDQDDYPRVSRDLRVLDPGADAPVTALEGLLYCFDAADLQQVAWCGDLLMVNGPQPRSRPTPNVEMPLNVLRRTDKGWQSVLPWQQGMTPRRFAPSPAGDAVLVHALQRVGVLPAGETREDAVAWLLKPEALGRGQVRGAVWSESGAAVLVSVSNPRGEGMADGLWRLTLEPDAEPQRWADAQGLPHAGWPGAGLLETRRNGRDYYSPRSLVLTRPAADPAAVVLVDDLHWNESFAVEPELPGRTDRPPGQPRIAYVRARPADAEPGGAQGTILLRHVDADGAVHHRELWNGPRAADGLTWSPDGRWLAFHARDAERKPWVWVMEVATGEAHRLGPGLRPAWGPPAR